jgi:lysozyme
MTFPVGIDVSHHKIVDWSIVKPNISFTFIKATEGTSFVDSKFNDNWNTTRELGIPRGAFHFFRSYRNTGINQATHFFNMLNSSGDLGNLPPVVDVERNDGCLSKSDYEQELFEFINTFESLANRELIIYTSQYKWDTFLGETNIPIDHKLWVADYDGDVPAIPADWADRFGNNCWLFWQYTESGRMPGVVNNVDINYFNGTIEDLETLTDIIIPSESPMEIVEVNCYRLNVRTRPAGSIIGTVPIRTRFNVAGEIENNYIPVVAWVHKNYVRRIQ